jgi:hypothetical protein
MAGPDPAIHVVMQENYFKSMYLRKNVDARLKAGHDDVSLLRLFGVLGGLALRKFFNAEERGGDFCAAPHRALRGKFF